MRLPLKSDTGEVERFCAWHGTPSGLFPTNTAFWYPAQFSSRVASKQAADGFGIGKSVKLPHEIDGTATDLFVLAVPFTAVDGDFA